MQNQPNNPGMSEKAWKQFQCLMARLNLKYAAQMIKEAPASSKAS
jgi:hypothetical protein